MRGRRQRTAVAVALGAAVLVVVSATSTAPAAAVGDTQPPAPFDMVANASKYQNAFEVASPYTSVTAAWYLSTDNVTSQLDIAYEVAVDGVVQMTVQAEEVGTGKLSRRVEVPDGSHALTVSAVDESGNRQPANQQLSVFVDKSNPTFGPGARLLMAKGTASADAVPVRFTWTADDVGTGIRSLQSGQRAHVLLRRRRRRDVRQLLDSDVRRARVAGCCL